MRIVDIMTSELITVTPATPIRDAANLMFRNKVSGLPVVNEDGMLVGIITEADFLRLEVARHEAEDPQPVETVDEVMSPRVLTIGPSHSITDAARTMVVNDVNRLPVVDDAGRLLGIVSRLDVVAVFTRPDEVIEDEVKEDVVRRVLFVDPESFDITVRHGTVTFKGEIGTRNEARLVEELVRRLDGVIRVDNQLEWRVDDGA